MKKKVILVTVGALVILAALVAIGRKANAPTYQATVTEESQAIPEPVPPPTAPSFNKSQFSTTDPASPWIIVNKVSKLPATYAPADLTSSSSGGYMRREATEALNRMVAEARKQGVSLSMLSGYRSYGTQVSTYNGYVAKDGQAAADTYSARPGHSEHQTGWAADVGNGICNLEICFGATTAGKWLEAHTYEYGFTVRYPAGKESITGYQYEPWHLRYVGVELASELRKTGQTIEEFFGVVPTQQPY